MAETEELPDEVKQFIVTELACYSTPSQVAAAVKEDFGIAVSRQRVHTYDPTKKAGKALSAELKALFEEARAQYLDETAKIGIAQPTFRLRMLERAYHQAIGQGNVKLALLVLEQAAKETGGFFTNRRILTGPDGKPIQTHNVNENRHENVTRDAAREKVMDELRAIFGAAVDAGEPAANAPRSDRAVPEVAGGGGAAEPGAPAPGEEVAGTQ